MKTLLYTLVFVLNTGLTVAAQIWDKRRLTERQRARAWNTASWGSAIYVASVASMIPWAWVTRNEWARWRERGLGFALARSALLLGAGLVAAALIYGVVFGVLVGVTAALGVPGLE
jgi:Flp pilus assembly protein TadB